MDVGLRCNSGLTMKGIRDGIAGLFTDVTSASGSGSSVRVVHFLLFVRRR